MAEFTFLYPAWLFALLPLLMLLPWLKNSSPKARLIAPHLAILFNSHNRKSKSSTLILLGLAWFIAVIALAAPSFQRHNVPAFTLNGARVLVMDMSLSLYAQDIEPNRLQQAKYKALDMLPSWKEGSTGLVTFAADSYIVSPLTEDANTLKNLIPELSPKIMPIAGSNVVAGVQQAMSLLSQANFGAGDIILITDEITEAQAEEILTLTANKNYRISILAIATKQGAPIPFNDGQLLVFNGATVIAKLELEPMAKITQATGGVLQTWQPTNSDVEQIVALNEIPISSSATIQDKEISERLNQGFWLLIPLLILALITFRRGIVLCTALFIIPVPKSSASIFETGDQRGLAFYQSKNYQQAAENFSSPSWKGVAEYQAGNYQAAIESLLAQKDAISRYNLGNAYAQAGEYQKALDIYQSLLEENPNHQDAKYNTDIVKKALEQQQRQQQDNAENNDQKNSQSSEKNQQEDHNQQANKDQNQRAQQENQENGEQNHAEDDEEQAQEKNDATQQANKMDEKNQENDIANSNKEELNGLTESNPTLKKLEQIPNDTAALIRAQLLLQAREKGTPKKNTKNW